MKFQQMADQWKICNHVWLICKKPGWHKLLSIWNQFYVTQQYTSRICETSQKYLYVYL